MWDIFYRDMINEFDSFIYKNFTVFFDDYRLIFFKDNHFMKSRSFFYEPRQHKELFTFFIGV
jgi:hypothetical protein